VEFKRSSAPNRLKAEIQNARSIMISHTKDVAMMQTYKLALLTAVLLGGNVSGLPAGDWPMLGRDATRNAVSSEKNPPTYWQIEGVPTKYEKRRPIEWTTESKNVRWRAELGVNTFSTPVVADGLVWIGTTHKNPGMGRPPGLLKCFRERDGQLLYEYESGVHEDAQDRYTGTPWLGISSSPLVEGDRIWFTSLGAELVCLDIAALKRGDGEPTIAWKRDMRKEWGVYPYACIMGPGFTGNVAVHKHLLYAITGNGSQGGPPPAPEAPSLVCLDKRTGELIWQDASPGANILNAQWGSPLVAAIGGRAQVIVPQGDGWIRSFNALTGELIWQFDINPKESKWTVGGQGTRNYFLAAPVFHDGRIYIASGHTPEHGEGPGRLVCIDPTQNGDISSELAVDADGNPLPQRRIQAVDPAQGERAVANPNSGLVWEYTKFDRDGNGEIDFEEEFHRSLSNVAIKDGLLIAADFSGLVHCVDAATGKVHWAYDLLASVWGSPLMVENKVYVADGDGEVTIFRLTAEAHEPLRKISLANSINSIRSSPVFANGTLYVANRNTLFAIAAEEPAAVGGHWPQWRGPNRDNVSTETGLLQEWPEEGPPLVWRVEGLGEGISPVSVTGGRLFTISRQDETEYVVALDEQTGRSLWSAYLGRTIQQHQLMQWLTQRTPTVDEDRLYAVSGLGDLACLRVSDGRELWRIRYEEDLEGRRGPYGFGDRPTVDGEMLIVTPGGAKAPVIALDKRSGEVRWKCIISELERLAYGTGLVAEIHGVRQYVTLLLNTVVGIAVDDGRLRWRHEIAASGPQFSTLTPFVRDDHVLVPAGYGQRVLLLKVVSHGDTFEASEVYAVRAFLDRFQDNTFLAGDHLYVFGNIAGCYHWKTGEAVWQKRIGNRAAATYADGRVYVRDVEGLVTLFEADPEDLAVRGKFTIPEAARSSGATFPVVAGGRLYLRDNDRLFCYEVRAEAANRSQTAARTIVLSKPDLVEPSARDRRTPRTGVDRAPDAVFVPTPHDVVAAMLKLAGVEKQDVVYDLGSGDGRIVIAAAKQYGARAVGVEIDPELVKLSKQQVQENKLADLVTIRHEDMFLVDLSEADVVAAFLYPRLLERLKPQFAKLKPGSRIVSHQFAMPGAKPDQVITMVSEETGQTHTLSLWTIPLTAAPQPPE
jgi:outer membrane protein assembly factor BamB